MDKTSQKEYLRKYLSSGVDKKKKKRKKPKIGTKTVTIIDDDVDLDHMRPMEDGEFEIFGYTEDAPQIAGVVDERGLTDFTDKRKWKIIADDGEGNMAVSTIQNQQSQTKTVSSLSNSDTEQNVQRKSKPRRDSDSDRSLPRKSKNDKKSVEVSRRSSRSPARTSQKSEDSDFDFSPPRKRDRKDAKIQNYSTNSDFDTTPPRKSKNDKKLSKLSRRSSRSPAKTSKKSRDSDFDFSPPRRRYQKDAKIQNYSTNSDSDTSPPRKSKNDKKSAQLPKRSSRSPAKMSKKSRDSDFDFSPPRKRHQKDAKIQNYPIHSDSDTSPPRKSKNDKRSAGVLRRSSRSPTRKSKVSKDCDSDFSPPRKHSAGGKRDSRAPSRKDEERQQEKRKNRDNGDKRYDREKRKSRSPRRPSRWQNDAPKKRSPSPDPASKDGDSRMKKTLDGKTAGLQDARALRFETEAHKKREADVFKKMSAEVSGVGKATVLRDRKTGRRRDLAAEAAVRREEEKRKEEIEEKYAKWGKGLKQVDDQKEKLERDLHEMNKPLARYADDEDLDRHQRQILYDNDPMLEYMRKQQIHETKGQPAKPTYQGSYPPNRFGIRPGYRWDGVDRSNGYEKKWFEARNARAARQEEAYKWSTADM